MPGLSHQYVGASVPHVAESGRDAANKSGAIYYIGRMDKLNQ